MIKLEKVEIYKYKSIENTQSFNVGDNITILVGMNESGKTNILEALAKVNYFNNDKSFQFDKIHDYPRKELKQIKDEFPHAVTCFYAISEELQEKIYNDLKVREFSIKNFSYTKYYDNDDNYNGIDIDDKKFIEQYFKNFKEKVETTIYTDMLNIKNIQDIDSIIEKVKNIENNEDILKSFEHLKNIYKYQVDNPIVEYIIQEWIKPNLPKFLYYDEYYSLPARVSIENLKNGKLENEELKTAKALFELANIDMDALVKSTDFENFKAELEATQSSITDEIFKYWDTNKNLEIEFDIEPISSNNNEHILNIRVRNTDKRVSLPLNKRSKGFNWFFSFLVWFKKIQEDKNSQYILLLDEPGLNLHAMAQGNLLAFLEELSKNYQIIYTTHSPFMIDSNHLDRVYTIYETKDGSIISDSVQQKDANTLFPLQAALGYSIAQNLFVNKNNLVVEGISDLVYLNYMSSLLKENNKEGLNDDIVIVPVGGADKVSAFISLMRGNELNIVCLLDNFTEQKPKSNVENLVKEKIIKQGNLKFYSDFVDNLNIANIEDIFSVKEYLNLFNEEFKEYNDINESDIDKSKTILDSINKIIEKDRFNHYRLAKLLASKALKINDFEQNTINRFETIFKTINNIFKNNKWII
ncbi:AAA family ATPase [Brachyspira aalborgi]|uniref:AAA family ATPase n=1 Tax=Brachyspira aalborgi TaxID=29522 RepID=A0A5C8CF55_9SPIR|nr:AAA family ATPase [Brachyspira aalborgi]TXJ10991.1 AAA family ATPase [Brachyspira aalborgi]